MKFYNADNIEVDLKQFESGSLVIMRVTKKLTEDEWRQFVKNNNHINDKFAEHNIQVVFCPDWIEFKEWR